MNRIYTSRSLQHVYSALCSISMLLVLAFGFIGCSPKKNDSIIDEISPRVSGYEADHLEEYRVQIYRVDNRVKVYANDDLIYNSDFIEGNPPLDISVGLSKHLNEGKNKITVELYNGGALWELVESMDERWEVFYEIFHKNEPIDYMHEQSSNGKTGLVYSTTHEIYVE